MTTLEERDDTQQCVPDLPEIHSNTLLVYVMSTPHDYKTRQRIRETWGNNSMYLSNGKQAMYVFFSTGKKCIDEQCNNTWLQSLQDEHKTFRDILLLDMLDNYENLTLKGILTMKWIVHHTHTRYLLKVDEDVVINPFAWIRLAKFYTKVIFVALLLVVSAWRAILINLENMQWQMSPTHGT